MEGTAELGVTIVSGVADRKQRTVNFVHSITGHLHHPFLAGMLSDSGDADAAPLQVQEEENVISCQPAPCEHLDGEEIDTSQRPCECE